MPEPGTSSRSSSTTTPAFSTSCAAAAKRASRCRSSPVKPLSTLRHLTLLPQTFGCRIPEELEREVLRHREDPKATREVGTEWAVAQSRELKQAGVPVLHYYPMGKADNIIKIAKAIF